LLLSLILGDEQYIEMNVGIIQKEKTGLGNEGDEDWSADSEPDSPPSPGKVSSKLKLLGIILGTQFLTHSEKGPKELRYLWTVSNMDGLVFISPCT